MAWIYSYKNDWYYPCINYIEYMSLSPRKLKMRVLLPCWPCYALRDASKWKKSQSFYIQRRNRTSRTSRTGNVLSFKRCWPSWRPAQWCHIGPPIGKHTNRVWLQRWKDWVFQSSRSPWSFFVSKTVALSQNCWQHAWGCLWSSHACTLFSEPKKDNKPVGPAPTSCMQAQTSFPLAGLHMQALLILYMICPNQQVSHKEPQHCSSLPCVAWKCDQ